MFTDCHNQSEVHSSALRVLREDNTTDAEVRQVRGSGQHALVVGGPRRQARSNRLVRSAATYSYSFLQNIIVFFYSLTPCTSYQKSMFEFQRKYLF